MTSADGLLLAALESAWSGESLRVPAAGWPAAAIVVARARFHGVVPFVRGPIERAPGGDVLGAALRDAERREFVRGAALWRELGRLGATLDAAGIPVVSLKGPALSAVAYGDPTLRSSDDLDLLVRPEDVGRALRVLARCGYVRGATLAPAHERAALRRDKSLELVRDGAPGAVDLHWALVPPHVGAQLTAGAWARAERRTVAGTRLAVLAPEDDLLYLVLHGYWHLWARFKWLCDLRAAIDGHGERLDPRQLAACSRALGVDDVLGATLALLDRLHALPPRVRHLAGPRPALDPADAPWPACESLAGLRIRVRLRRRFVDRLRTVAAFLPPTPADYAARRLPAGLGALYWLYRPVRLVREYAR